MTVKETCLKAKENLTAISLASEEDMNKMLAAAAAALREQDFVQTARRIIAAERPALAAALRGLGFWVCGSHANYLLFRGPPGLREALLARGISIRSCHSFQGLGPGWYRVAVRLHHENEALIAALADAVKRS